MNTRSEEDRRGGSERRSGDDRRDLPRSPHRVQKTEQKGKAKGGAVGVTRPKPDFARIWNQKGEGFFKEERDSDARESFENSKKINPGFAPPWYNLAILHSIAGDKRETFSHLKKALSIDPNLKKAAKTEIHFEKLLDDDDFKLILDSI